VTLPNSAEQINADYSALQSTVSSLQEKVHMSEARSALAELDAKIKSLPQTIANLRSRKYAFDAVLESKAVDLLQRWAGVKPGVDLFIQQQTVQLETAIQPIEARMSYIAGQLSNPEYASGVVREVQAQASNLESKVSGAVSTASGMYSALSNQYYELDKHIDALNYTLDQIDQACFKMMAAESIIMAIKATWTRDGKEDRDDPQGNLYLTDQRLVYEQKQEVATKKVLFITTEKKMVQQVLFEAPIALVCDVKGSKQGLFKNEDYLDLTFAAGAPVKSAQFHIFGQDFKNWIELVNRACAHDFDKDRVIAPDRAEVEKIKAAPTVCPNCGGALPKVILRGQDTITCEFCGHVIRL
jgi:hypothetical protein